MRFTAAALLAGSLAAPASGAAGEAPEDVAAVLEPIRAEYTLPALAGAVLRGDRLSALGASGLRKRGSPEAATAADLWHLGSCTKAMTATLAARLVEAGRVSWNTRVEDALPALAAKIHRDFRGATLEQLLAHRGGAPNDYAELPIWSWLWSSRAEPRDARSRFAAAILARRPEHAPGSAYLYSNAGYVIAGAMLETAAGAPYEELLRGELFEPLGMASAGFGPPGRAGAVEQPWGHAGERRGARPVEPGPAADNPPALAPAGTVHATLADWARFVALHLAGARGEPTSLSPESMRKLHTPPAGDYALGWIAAERDWAGGAVLTHRGSNTLWVAEVWILPKLDAAVLVTTNQGGPRAEEAVQRAISELARHAFAPR